MNTIRAYGEDGVKVSRLTEAFREMETNLVPCMPLMAYAGIPDARAMAEIYRMAYEQAYSRVYLSARELASWVSVN